MPRTNRTGKLLFAPLLAALGIFFAGCKSAGTAAADEVRESMPVQNRPPALAVESFQAAWEIIRDTHFDTNFNGLGWNAVRAEFLPKVTAARTRDEVRDTIQEMLDLLGHSHLMIIPGTPPRASGAPDKSDPATTAPLESAADEKPENGSIGIEVRVVDGRIAVFRVEPGAAAAAAGVKPGWILKEIDGEPAIDGSIEGLELSEKEREFMLWHHAAHLLKGAVGSECSLIAETNDGIEREVSIPRARESGAPAKLGNLPTLFTRTETNQIVTPGEKRVGYLRFNLWMLPAVAVIDRFVDEHRNADAIIVDMRGNLGGIGGMVMGVAGHFVSERAPLGKMKMRDNELSFVAFPRRVDSQSRPTNTFRGKLAILADGITLSTAELFAGGLQELGRARVFGDQTGGQALPSVSDRLPNGDLLYHAVADFTTPKGRRLEGNGVTPDEIIPLRLEALRAGRDEVLEAALQWIER